MAKNKENGISNARIIFFLEDDLFAKGLVCASSLHPVDLLDSNDNVCFR